MKFEQLLKIYWSRNFLYGGKTQSFDVTLEEFFQDKPGLGPKSINIFLKRFELHYFASKNNRFKTFLTFSLSWRKVFNIYLSKLNSINHSIYELHKFNLIRLYLIKTFRGRCHALGKPSRGQRTWSNASNAYICNKTTRTFIQEVKKFNFVEKKAESLNRKFIKKIIKKKAPKIKMVFTKKRTNFWF